MIKPIYHLKSFYLNVINFQNLIINRYPAIVHGTGLCDEWPFIKWNTDGGEQSGQFEKDMTISVEAYVGEVGGKEGVKLEQQFYVGENGLELLSHHPLEDL